MLFQIGRKLCDCGKSSESAETEMSTHSQQQLQGGGPHGPGIMTEVCHNNHLLQQRAGAPYLTMTRQPIDVRNQESIYAKQLAAVGIQPSPGKLFFWLIFILLKAKTFR